MTIPSMLREKGLRATPQRTIILELLHEVVGHQHQTAQELFQRAQERLPGLNLATIYRTLEGLFEAGLVDRMDAGQDNVRYSLRDPAHLHGHLRCRNCHQGPEIGPEDLTAIAHLIEERYGFVLDVNHLTLNGVCENCLTFSASYGPLSRKAQASKTAPEGR
jgi:Fur family ferric uptake transcriptional regulator